MLTDFRARFEGISFNSVDDDDYSSAFLCFHTHLGLLVASHLVGLLVSSCIFCLLLPSNALP
jgi:hypothetical protein